jgi:hypothetical protein
MGTSTGYNAPTTPQWRALKGQVSRTARRGEVSPDTARDLVSGYISAGGGSGRVARGGGSAGGGAGARVAANIGAFLATSARRGFVEALREFGLASLLGRPIGELLDALVDRLGGASSTMDDVDARNALSRLRDEIMGDVDSVEELEQVLNEQAAGAAFTALLTRYFALYLHEQFSRVFYERLVARVGPTQADTFLGSILDYLQSRLEEAHLEFDIRTVDWAGEAGRAFAEDMLEETLNVFGG